LSPSPEQIEYAGVLQPLAMGDLQACRVLVRETGIEDSIVGFHAQQAVEKALKVALVLAGTELPRTHDLELLVEQVERTEIHVPDLSGTAWLTPWAAELRYDEPIALDRTAALVSAESAVGWSGSLLADSSAVDDQQSAATKIDDHQSGADPAPAQ
jgi:hypothetical protein